MAVDVIGMVRAERAPGDLSTPGAAAKRSPAVSLDWTRSDEE
jgi:hypothetical protein